LARKPLETRAQWPFAPSGLLEAGNAVAPAKDGSKLVCASVHLESMDTCYRRKA
jgi:hypothetical protein